MAETKQLILVVEGTTALRHHWSTIRSNYLDKIIRSFCGNEDPASSLWSPDRPIVELALVNFKIHGPYSSCLVQRSSWTNNMDIFLDWLSTIDFSVGGKVWYAGIAEGLAEALMMFPCVKLGQNHQRHCILIAESDPEPFPKLVYNPPETGSHLSIAKTVAESFQRCLVSLSVISPNPLSDELRAIYNSARRNPSETDPTIGIVKNRNHLILISESFTVARAALSKPEITIIDLTEEEESEEMTSSRNVSMPTQFMVNDNVSTNVGPASQQSTSIALQSEASEFVWKGDLYGHRRGMTILITRLQLQCNRNKTSSESLAKDWPENMDIDRFITHDQIQSYIDPDHIKNNGKVDYLEFKARLLYFYLELMQEKKLSMVIRLPSQILFLSVSDEVTKLFGMLVSKEMVIYKPVDDDQEEQDPSRSLNFLDS